METPWNGKAAIPYVVCFWLLFSLLNIETLTFEGIHELETPVVINTIKHQQQILPHVSLYILELIIVDDGKQKSELQTHTTRLIIQE